MVMTYLRLITLTLLAMVFAGYHTACACAHSAQAVAAVQTVHHDMSTDMSDGCHDMADEHSDISHDCQRFLDRLDVKFISLIKPEMVSLKPILPPVSDVQIFDHTSFVKLARRPGGRPPDIPHRSDNPLTLKVRLLN